MKVPGFYSLVLGDSESVRRAWLPFLEPGGLFVPTRREHVLGEELVLLVQLPDNTKQSFAGRVAWISAAETSGGRRRGIGVALEDSEGRALMSEFRNNLAQESPPESVLLSLC